MTDNSDQTTEPNAIAPETQTIVLARDQSAGSSKIQLGELVDREQPGISASSLDEVLWQLSGTDSRKVGVSVLLQVASAWAKETNTKVSLIAARQDKLIDDLTKSREENAALKAKEAERARHGPLVIAMMICSPILAGIGLDQIRNNQWGVGITALILTVGLIAVTIYVRREDR